MLPIHMDLNGLNVKEHKTLNVNVNVGNEIESTSLNNKINFDRSITLMSIIDHDSGLFYM